MKYHPILAISIASIIIANPVSAATFTWDGGGANDNLAAANNWSTNIAPGSDLVNTDLIFDGIVRLTPNVSVAFSANSLVFNNNAAANGFTFGGSTLTIGAGGISNLDGDTQTFGNQVTIGTASSIFDAVAGQLVFNGTVALGTNALSVKGSSVTFGGPLTGTGTITKSTTGAFNISATATAIGADLILTGATTTLVATGTTQTFSSTSTVVMSGTGTFAINENLVLDGAQLTRATGASFTLATGKTLTIQNGGDAIITGAFTQSTASTISVTGAGSTFSATGNISLNGGSTTNILAGGGLSAGASAVAVASGTNGTLTVDGSGSSVSAATFLVAQSGATGNASFTNGSSGALGILFVGGGTGAGTNGTLAIQSGATVTGTALQIASGVGTVTGSLTINGAGSALSLSSAAAANIGAASASTGTLNVQNGGVFSSSTGLLTVNATGTVAITGGTFNANGDMIVNGQLTLDGTGFFTLAAGKTLTVQGGGDAIIANGFSNFTASTIIATGAGSTLIAGSSLTFSGGSTTNVLLGGDISGGGGGASVNIGAFGTLGSGTVTVDGSGSRLAGGHLIVGRDGETGSLTFSNGSTGTFSDIKVASGSLNGTSGTLSIQSGASVSGTALTIASGGTAGTVTITGAGSALTLTSATASTIGYPGLGLGTGTLDVQSGGSFTGGTGTFTLNATGTVNVGGGTATFGGLFTNNGGAVTFTSGALAFTNTGVNLTIGTGGLLGTDLTLLSNRQLTIGGTTTVDAARTLTIIGGTFSTGALVNNGTLDFQRGVLGITGAGGFNIGTGVLGALVRLDTAANLQVTNTTTIDPFSALTINGGSFSTGALVNNGTLDFQRGTLAITGAGGINIGTGTLGANVALGPGSNLLVTNTATIASGAALTLYGGAFTGGTLNNSGTLRVNLGAASASAVTNGSGGRIFVGDTLTTSGGWTNAAGGTLTLVPGGLVNGAGAFTNSGLVTGDGTITKPVTNSASGQLRAEAGRTLTFTGAVAANAGTFSMLGGTLEFTTAIANASGGFISGSGALITAGLTNSGNLAFTGDTGVFGDVTNAAGARIITSGGATTTFYDDVVNNGAEIRTSTGSKSVFLGATTGAGPYTGTGTVYFEGDLRPGNSPATVGFGGDVVLSSSAALTMELGGRTKGTQYDSLNVAGSFAADGILALSLINGFAPALGDMFDLLDFASITGTFDSFMLPALAQYLAWNTSALYATGEVSVTTTLTPIEQWRLLHFGSPANSGDGADDNDFDKDGTKNLLEYALGLDPLVPSTSGLPTLSVVSAGANSHIALTVTRPLSATDITYQIEVGGALISFLPGSSYSSGGDVPSNANTTQVSRTPDGSGNETIFVRDNTPLSGTPSRFLRLKVSHP